MEAGGSEVQSYLRYRENSGQSGQHDILPWETNKQQKSRTYIARCGGSDVISTLWEAEAKLSQIWGLSGLQRPCLKKPKQKSNTWISYCPIVWSLITWKNLSWEIKTANFKAHYS